MITFLQLHIPGEPGRVFPANAGVILFGRCNTSDAFRQPNKGLELLPARTVCADLGSKGNPKYLD